MQFESNTAWRPACEFIEGARDSEIVLIFDHALNFIPEEYRRLGFEHVDLIRHVAWDIAAVEVTRTLSKLGCPAFLGAYSRLLIDLNRHLGWADSIPLRSEDAAIPGNAALSVEKTTSRSVMIFTPFRDRMKTYLDSRRESGLATRLVTIHGFAPIYLGMSWPWHVGVLLGRAEQFADRILPGLQCDRSQNAALNQPYVASTNSDYTIPVHGDDRPIEGFLHEIRNDLITDAVGAEEWAARLWSVLSPDPLPSRVTSPRYTSRCRNQSSC